MIVALALVLAIAAFCGFGISCSLLVDIHRARRHLLFARADRLRDCLFATVIITFSIAALAAASFIDGVSP